MILTTLKVLILLMLPGIAVRFTIMAPFILDRWLKAGPCG